MKTKKSARILPGKDKLIFSTGKTIYANRGIVGISGDTDDDGEMKPSISEGYDGGIDQDDLTKQERQELANWAIKLWKLWALKKKRIK